MNHGTCIHFTGIDVGPRYKESCCKAGVKKTRGKQGELQKPYLGYHEIYRLKEPA